ncbi:hypothetical protein [Microbacterium sp. Leaf151]|uniref:hypothetical protein n=1 Tax=Microbacterium sp. Leaf151 TaxID=1736276 RepID=UPI0006FE39DD|nr:hypothetical protein [Microbacterium sp. Leaf151]KQR25353.1 hypothetical protein ASF76_06905 [Microbacterium sp. Leaf151]
MPHDIDTSPRGPWGWIGVWVREEKFWRDIGARVLAGVVTAAIVYAGALLLGYLHTPEIGAGLLLGLGIVACAGLVAGSATLVRSARARRKAGASGGARVVLAVVLLFAAIAIATGVATDVLR